MVSILRLTNSDDFNPEVPVDQRSAALAERVFAEHTGERLETDMRRIWPTPDLADIVDRWVATTRPDIVLLRVAAYWVTFESVPVRLGRRLGRLAGPAARVGQRLASSRAGRTRAFHAGRRRLLSAIGGDPNFTIPEVLGVMEATIRRVLAHEDVVLVVRGPQNPLTADVSPAGIARAESRRLAFHSGLADVCRRLHVDYIGREQAYSTAMDEGSLLGDLVHASAHTHLIRGTEEGEVLARVWLAARGRQPAG